MDPHYSVLLEDDTKGNCDIEKNKREGINTTVLAIVLPVVVVSIFLIGAAVYFYPKY